MFFYCLNKLGIYWNIKVRIVFTNNTNFKLVLKLYINLLGLTGFIITLLRPFVIKFFPIYTTNGVNIGNAGVITWTVQMNL